MNRNNILFPLSIVIVAVIIAGGVLISNREYKQPELPPTVEIDTKIDIRPITNNDHLIGNPNANVIIVEYGDMECPTCKEFHPTMERIIDEYGKNGEVAWVYRHFTVDEVHPLARGAALASECVVDAGKSVMFWDFIRTVYTNAPESLSPENLKSIALTVGVDEAKYEACVVLNKFEDKVNADIADGKIIREHEPTFGTPFLIITSQSGSQLQISGAEEYESLVEIIEALK